MPGRNQKEAKRELIAAELEITEARGIYRLTYEGMVIRTSCGAEVAHSSQPLLRQMIAEFDIEGSLTLRGQVIVSPRFFSAYAIFGIQKEFVDDRKEGLTVDLERILFADRILHSCAGPEVTEQMARWSPALQFLERNGQKLPSLPQSMTWRKPTMKFRREIVSNGFKESFVDFVLVQYQCLPPEKRAVVTYLNALHRGPVLFPLVLAHGFCTADEYASGVMAAECSLAKVFGMTAKAHRKAFIALRDDARTALEYIRHTSQ